MVSRDRDRGSVSKQGQIQDPPQEPKATTLMAGFSPSEEINTVPYKFL